MRIHTLLLDLKAFLDATLAEISLPDPVTGQNALGKAMCFFGNVPDTNAADLSSRFPFVVIRWLEGESDEEGKNLETVALILGVFAPEGPGEAELVTAMLADHLRRKLMENRLLANMFELQLPLSSSKPDPEKRQHQYHYAIITTRWDHRTPRRTIPSEGEPHE